MIFPLGYRYLGRQCRIRGESGQRYFNDQCAARHRDPARLPRGRQGGQLKQRFSLAGLSGGWADEVSALNTLIDDLVSPTTEATRAVGAVAKGDVSQFDGLERDGRPLEGEFLRGAMLLNRMIEQLSVFASEVTRVAREVGTEASSVAKLRSMASVACGKT